MKKLKDLFRRSDLCVPTLVLVTSLALTGFYCAWLVWFVHQTQWKSIHQPPADVRFEQLRTVILQLDDLLTLSTRMAASTGEAVWREQHHKTARQLETALRQATKLASDDRLLRYARQVDQAGERLVKTENQALTLAQQGRTEDARELLYSASYATTKTDYAQAVTRLVNEFRSRFRETMARQELQARSATLVAAGGSGLALLAWIAAIVVSHRSQRRLEGRVRERTAALAVANETLQAAEAKYRNLLEELPAIAYLIEVNQSNPWTYVSPKIETLLGFPAAEWCGNPLLWRNQLHPDDRRRVITEQARCAASGQPFVETYRLFTRDGRVLWFSDHAVLLPGDDGKPPHWHGLMIDITAWKTLEEQLRQVQKVEAVGQLAGGIAHDFNNILTVIGGFAALILQDCSDHPLLHRHATEIERATYRASRLTRQLLAFSRRQQLEPRVVDLAALVADLARMLRRVLGEDLNLKILSPANLGRVRVDPGQIEQVILNLAIYARDSMPRGGVLTIESTNVELTAADVRRMSAMPPGGYVLLRLADTGHGLTEEVRSHLFEPFYNGRGDTAGTGLELATCFGIIKQSGGHIEVESAPEAGTTFRIYLPRLDQPAEVAVLPAEVGAAPRGKETVLLVEDDAAVRDLGAVILGELGYRVLTAEDGAAALALMQENRDLELDLLVTDLVMPQIGGRELADTLHAAQPELKVLFVSGYSEDVICRHGVLARNTPFLHKPYTPGAFARQVRAVLDGAEATSGAAIADPLAAAR